MTLQRTQGVRAANAPNKETLTVQASDFLIGGLIGKFERNYEMAMQLKRVEDFIEIFGDAVYQSTYGWDCAKGFFDNIIGSTGTLYVKGHVGYTGTEIDGVAANATIQDQDATPEDTLKITAAYKENKDYGVAGNRTGFEIINGNRFITATDGVGLTTDTWVVVDAITGFRIGDIIEIKSTTDLYRKVTDIDEANKKVIFTPETGEAVPDASVVNVLGFQLKTHRKNIRGISDEVEEELGKIWCTMEPEVSDFYVENIHSQNRWILVEDLSSTSVLQDSFPADTTEKTFLANGSDGTSPTTPAHWSADLTAMDSLPVRMLANTETSDIEIQKAGELYCKQRSEDNPIWLYILPENQNYSQLITKGNNFKRGDDVIGVIVANWLKVVDPYTNSPLAPKRHIPNVGHVMGCWIRSIELNGIHVIPARFNTPLYSVSGVVGDQLLDDERRTDVVNAGVNIIQDIQGSGIYIKSMYTPSDDDAFKFANGILMRNFIKVSGKDSLKRTENEPNSFDRIKESRMALLEFGLQLWLNGSNGKTPEGQTFGQTFVGDDPNQKTKFDDHYEVKADLENNPQDKIDLGERNLTIHFSYPAPAASIFIYVGLLI